MDVFLYVCICILGVERLDWIRKCTLGPSANCGAGAQQMNGGRAGWLRTVPWRDCAIAQRGKYLDSRAVAVCLCAKMTVGGGWSRHSGGPTGRLGAAAAAATAMDRWVDGGESARQLGVR